MGGLGVTKSLHTSWGYGLELYQVPQGKKTLKSSKLEKFLASAKIRVIFKKFKI